MASLWVTITSTMNPGVPVDRPAQIHQAAVHLHGHDPLDERAGIIEYRPQHKATAVDVAAKTVKPGQDFFPLTVNYQEKYFASGRIPGGFFKREGRPTEKETLVSRLIDRPIRPLFPSGFRNEVQVLCTVALIAASRRDYRRMVGAAAERVGRHRQRDRARAAAQQIRVGERVLHECLDRRARQRRARMLVQKGISSADGP